MLVLAVITLTVLPSVAIVRATEPSSPSAPSDPVVARLEPDLRRTARAAADYPPEDSGYYTYAEMEAELDAAVADHPAIVRKLSIGRSYHGREIWAAKVSDQVAVDENEPEVLFDALHHAREHLTPEMALSVLELLTDNYATGGSLGARVTELVDSREIWIVFMVNPDGLAYDLGGSPYRGWRKNRQPNQGSTAVGIDPNRNYGYRWGCCNGSSPSPSSYTYRGPGPWTAPETVAIRDFVNSRVVDGRQQLRLGITFHAAGEEILWPYGYTTADVPADMTSLDHSAIVAMARAMAATNGYTPMQASSLYINDGNQKDWMYGAHRIFHYTFELYPAGGGGSVERFYPPDEVIERETTRNHEAVLYLLEQADCRYREIGRETSWCGPLFDDFEIPRGWTPDPNGTDTATTGRWERGNPEPTSQDGPRQLGTTNSGRADLVTGRLAGGCVGCNDVDGGITSVRSTEVALPNTGGLRLRFRWALGHGANATAEDLLRLRIITGSTATTVWEISGGPSPRDAAWATAEVDLAPFAGQRIRLQFEAADLGTPSLIEAAIDDIRIPKPS